MSLQGLKIRVEALYPSRFADIMHDIQHDVTLHSVSAAHSNDEKDSKNKKQK